MGEHSSFVKFEISDFNKYAIFTLKFYHCMMHLLVEHLD